jgi:alpha-galactosidase
MCRADDPALPTTQSVPSEMADAQSWLGSRVGFLAGPNGWQQEPLFHCLQQGWGNFQRGWSVNHLPITLNRAQFADGFGSHADSVVEVILPTGSARLTGVCGVDDTPEARQAGRNVLFTIEADGKEIFRTSPQRADLPPAKFDIDLHGISKLTLRAKCLGNDVSYAPVDWADLRLTDARGAIHILGTRLSLAEGYGPLFSFLYDGRPIAAQIGQWKFQRLPRPDSPFVAAQTFIWTDPATGLQCRLDIRQYHQYPVLQWVMHLKNTGLRDTPILQDISPMDLAFAAAGTLLLHHNTGDYAAPDSYQPFVDELKTGDARHFAPDGGRPTNRGWPYFNVEHPDDHQGIIFAVGWPGQWSADFSRDPDGFFRARAGQELTHLRLHPGEEIRTPMCVAMFYRGDYFRAQNRWRRWMLDCVVPRADGGLPKPIFASSLGLHQSLTTETDGINRYTSHGAELTHWWMDAGWYPCPDGQWWVVGSWWPAPPRFPNGLKPISDLAHSKGLKLILWFEPERVHPGTWLYQVHPEWLLRAPGADDRLLDLGNKQAWIWLMDHVDQQLTEQGVDVYRQDFNFDPLPYWRANDAPDRQGITEIRHVEGYLAYWDELHRRHPHLLIDTCASGGRRLDLETLSRSISLWSSDDNAVPEDSQSHTFGLASWVPYFGTGIGCDNSYLVRSDMMPILQLGDPTAGGDVDWDLYHLERKNWARLSQDQLGDYYPLLPYSLDKAAWIAWQFNLPEADKGAVQVFRRGESPFTSALFPLHGIDKNATYLVTDVDDPNHPRTFSGSDLTSPGLPVQINSKPYAAIFFYSREK